MASKFSGDIFTLKRKRFTTKAQREEKERAQRREGKNIEKSL
jgi:hypothetical protein